MSQVKKSSYSVLGTDMTALRLLLVLTLILAVASFHYGGVNRRLVLNNRRVSQRQLSMEYIPDGMTKEQWKKLKQKEADESKDKNYGAIGITKFKSRSFEAWQKSGGKNLFPVSPDTPLEERPYMQRTGGSADGDDLKKRGLFGRGQAKASARTDVDDKYDDLEAKGALKSTPFELPWSNSAAKKLAKEKAEAAKAEVKTGKVRKAGKAGPFGGAKKGSPYGAAAKAARRAAAEAEAAAAAEPEPEPKKKLFGLF